MQHPKRIETVHAETLEGELCIYDWQRMEVHNLNPTAATVWQLCDGQTTPQQMAGQLKGDLTPAQAEELVWLTLKRLEKANLLENKVVKPAGRKVLTRREMLKGLGVAAVMLPVVSSIVAPGPVEAQSPGGPAPTYIGDATAELILYNAGERNGNLGGRASADALCVAAKNANLNPNYTNFKAFISIQAGDAIADLPIPTTLPIKSENGTTIFTDRADMLDGDNPTPSLFAAGVTPTANSWWSASDDNGGYNGGAVSNCNNFTDGTAGESGRPGNTDPIFNFGAEWINGGGTTPCNITLYILCIAY